MVERQMVGNLLPPKLFQAPDGTLDLVHLNPGDPVVVGVFLRDAAAGEEFVVYFGEDEKKVAVPSAKRFVNDALFSVAELPPAGQRYQVSYTFRNQMSPEITIDLVDSSTQLLAPKLHISSLSGTYGPGVLDAWVVPVSYQLTPALPAIASIGEMPANMNDLTLSIGRRDASGGATAIGSILYDKGQGAWSVHIFESVQIEQGDVLSIELLAGPSVPVRFSACF